MRARAIAAALAATATLAGCSSSTALVGHWVHSHEEDSTGVRTYRPSTYPFPLSRGRERWEFRADGTALHHPIAPADGLETHAGTWSLGDEGLLTIVTVASDRPWRFNVVTLDTGMLRLQVLR